MKQPWRLGLDRILWALYMVAVAAAIIGSPGALLVKLVGGDGQSALAILRAGAAVLAIIAMPLAANLTIYLVKHKKKLPF